jgi:aryl-alcohol dehydrogenase-like predicted oxidoreductase
VEAGGNFIDTANDYTGGKSEDHLGKFISSSTERDRFVIATKYSANMRSDDPNSGGNSRKSMVHSVDASLKRLRSEYIDLLWVHMWDSVTPNRRSDAWTPRTEVDAVGRGYLPD